MHVVEAPDADLSLLLHLSLPAAELGAILLCGVLPVLVGVECAGGCIPQGSQPYGIVLVAINQLQGATNHTYKQTNIYNTIARYMTKQSYNE